MKRLLIMGIILVLLLAGVGAVSANLVSNGGFEKPKVTNGAGWDIFQDNTLDLDWDVQWAAGGPTTFLYTGDGITYNRPEPANAELQTTGLLKDAVYPDFPGGQLNAAEGNQYAELDSDWFGPSSPVSGEPANVIMSQSIVTQKDHTYTISWEQRRRNDDGHSPSSLAFSWNGDGPLVTTGVAESWTKYSETRSASGPSTIISFSGVPQPGDSLGALIDDVIVQDTTVAVPEFPTMALPVALMVGLLGAVLFIRSTKEN